MNSGYAPNGNILDYYDSVMGTWNLSSGYDSLNRLSLATQTPISGAAQSYCWTYDTFGNRTTQATGTQAFTVSYSGSVATCQTSGMLSTNEWAHYTIDGTLNTADNGKNQVTAMPTGGFRYDVAGNIISDPPTAGIAHNYFYDAEGRICAVFNNSFDGMSTMTGYLYDADGIRVAKGSITSWSCDPAANGFSTTNDYILDLGNQQATEMGMDKNNSGNTGMVWAHSNVWAGGKLLATYDPDGLHFYFDDPLGTRRVQTDYEGAIEQQCQSLPFGDGETCAPTPTENLFTGKERDAESGLDYFDARHYSSAMGRFMSPDWAAKEEPVPYATFDDPQSLNLYSYVRNNPLSRVDKDGHCAEDGCAVETLIGIGIVAYGTVEGLHAYYSTPAGQRSLNTFSSAASESISSSVQSVKDKVTSIFSFNKKVKAGAAENAGQKCEYCGTGTVPAKKSAEGVTPPKNEQQTDHYDPKAKGGTDDKGNAVNACRGCNREKSDTSPEGTKWELPRMKPPPPPDQPPHN